MNINYNYNTIVLLHKMPNRIRVKFNLYLKNVRDFQSKLSEHEGITHCSYNRDTKSLVVYFDYNKIQVEELLIRITILYSGENNFIPVKIVSGLPKSDIPLSAFYSLGMIAISTLSSVFIRSNNIKDILNWITVGLTAFSIVEHAQEELETKGAVDPEVVSIMYLLNAARKGNYIDASALTWITTYGRHFIDISIEEIILKVNRVENKCSGETFYNVSMINDHYKNRNLMRALVTNFIERHSPNTRNDVMFTNRNISLVNDRVFCGFRNECDKIILDGMGNTNFSLR